MSQQIRFDRITFASVRATERTEWTFAEISDSRGATALVELTCGEATARAATLFAELSETLRSRGVADESEVADALELHAARLQRDRPLATAVSALRTALVSLRALHKGQSLTEALGGAAQGSVALYANVNRSMLGANRTSADFGSAAERAVRAGFTTLKCAPFDEVRPPASSEETLELARPGFERVAAVRATVGPDVGLLVDCHSRFEAHSAPLVAEQLAKFHIGWFEEPLEPTEQADALATVADSVEMPVAGGESGYGAPLFLALVRSGAVSVIMPDIKYCGGAAEACSAGRAALEAGGQVSLHSPSGPVSQLASAHATLAIGGALPLEHAVNEAPWRSELLQPQERIEGGRLHLPGGSGLGATLDYDVVRRYGRTWNQLGPTGRACSIVN